MLYRSLIVCLAATALFAQQPPPRQTPPTQDPRQNPAATPPIVRDPGPGSSRATSGAGNISAQERSFIMQATRGGRAEVDMGRMAVEKASDPKVKEFGQKMIDDHTRMNQDLENLARQKNMNLPNEASVQSHGKMSNLSGKDFDRAYMNEMLSDHRKDVAEFEKESNSAKDPDLKAFVDRALPTLKEHLSQIQSLSGSVGTNNPR